MPASTIKGAQQAVPLVLSFVVVSLRSVILPGLYAAFVEIYVRSRKGTDHCAPASQGVLCLRVQPGNPRFTRDSDGKPLRRLPL